MAGGLFEMGSGGEVGRNRFLHYESDVAPKFDVLSISTRNNMAGNFSFSELQGRVIT